MIYYLERYSTQAYNWDNSAVDYTNAKTANTAADVIDDLIEDWHEDATEYTSISIPFIGYISYPVASFRTYLPLIRKGSQP